MDLFQGTKPKEKSQSAIGVSVNPQHAAKGALDTRALSETSGVVKPTLFYILTKK